MRQYQVELIGKTPLLVHRDNIEFQTEMEHWRSRPENKKKSKAGDDRTPPHTWIGYLYHDEKYLCIPQDNLRSCMMEAGKKIPKGKSNYKVEAASQIIIDAPYITLLIDGKPIPFGPIDELLGSKDLDFVDHLDVVRKLGFTLHIKRAAVGQAKHVRVRPQFYKWSLAFQIEVLDDSLTEQVLNDIFEVAGRLVGLCDWRPGEKKSPGPFGQFDYKLVPLKAG